MADSGRSAHSRGGAALPEGEPPRPAGPAYDRVGWPAAGPAADPELRRRPRVGSSFVFYRQGAPATAHRKQAIADPRSQARARSATPELSATTGTATPTLGVAGAIGSTSQKVAARSGSWRTRSARADPAPRCASSRRTSSIRRVDAVRPLGQHGAQPDGRDAPLVERRRVAPARVVQVGAPAGHPCPEVGSDRSQDDDRAARHVLAAVRADALDDGLGARVPDGEAHPGPTDQVQAAPGRAIQAGVPGDRLPAGRGPEVRLRRDRDRASRQALGDVVVGLPDETQFDARPGECPERLTRGTAQLELDGPVQLASLEGARQTRPRPSGRRSSREARTPRPNPGHGAPSRSRSPAPTPAHDGSHGRRTADRPGGRRRRPMTPRR